MIRLYMFMKLIFLHLEPEIFLKKVGQGQVYQLQFVSLVMTSSGYQG